jgi:hypothetical protein
VLNLLKWERRVRISFTNYRLREKEGCGLEKLLCREGNLLTALEGRNLKCAPLSIKEHRARSEFDRLDERSFSLLLNGTTWLIHDSSALSYLT